MPLEVRVVLIHHNPARTQRFRATAGTDADDPFARFVLSHQLEQPETFPRRVFWMRMVVIETSAVVNNQVALQFLEGNLTLTVLLKMHLFIEIVQEFIDLEASSVFSRILELVVPERHKFGIRITPYQLHRLLDDVYLVDAFDRDAILRFDPEESIRQLDHTRLAALFRVLRADR